MPDPVDLVFVDMQCQISYTSKIVSPLTEKEGGGTWAAK